MASPKQSYLRDWIYGGVDGTVTTFAVVSGVVGGQLSTSVILILGFANLLADGFSMAASNYLGTQSEVEQYNHYKMHETSQTFNPVNNNESFIRDILSKKGLHGSDLHSAVNMIISNKILLIDFLLREKYGLPISIRSPLKASIYTFISFVMFGLVPLIPYVLQINSPFIWSCCLTGCVFFSIGSMKSYWSLHSWIYSGIETLIIGSVTAGLAFYIGHVIHLIVNVT